MKFEGSTTPFDFKSLQPCEQCVNRHKTRRVSPPCKICPVPRNRLASCNQGSWRRWQELSETSRDGYSGQLNRKDLKEEIQEAYEKGLIEDPEFERQKIMEIETTVVQFWRSSNPKT